MTEVWLTIALVAVASFALKAGGPLILGDRQLGPRATRVVALLAPALLTALVLVDTVTSGQRLVVDARLAGVVAAGVAMLLRGPPARLPGRRRRHHRIGSAAQRLRAQSPHQGDDRSPSGPNTCPRPAG